MTRLSSAHREQSDCKEDQKDNQTSDIDGSLCPYLPEEASLDRSATLRTDVGILAYLSPAIGTGDQGHIYPFDPRGLAAPIHLAVQRRFAAVARK